MWQDNSLKEEVAVTTTSCLEAVRHSDHQALIEYLKNCKYTKQLRQNYLNERLKLAAAMGNFTAVQILMKEMAQSNPAFQKRIDSFDFESIQHFIMMQYVDDIQIETGKKRVLDKKYDPKFIPSFEKFQQKKQKIIDLLSDPRTLMISTLNHHPNIALALQRRESTGTI